MAEANDPEVKQDDIEQLRASAAKAVEYLDLAKRTQAEFINYQNRARREREELSKYAVESFVRELLPVLDGLVQTLAAAEGTQGPLVEGVRIVENELLRVLAKAGIKPIPTQGKKFDPEFHEAVAMVEAAGQEDSTIVEEVRRGYTIHDRVLRPAHVKVARKAQA